MPQPLLPPTAFIGRTQETDAIVALLADPACRLLTLVGAGGMGKTRLALEVVARQQALFPDGVFIASLATLNRTADMLTAIAEATPFRFQHDNRHPKTQFLAYLRAKRDKQMLLVLDNFEQLLDGVAIISEMVAATDALKILVTSRAALNLQEEWVRHVVGLTYPTHNGNGATEGDSAVQLFAERARRIRGDFDLAHERDNVVEICRLVEGMPLAIELAAGWLNTLQPAEIAQEIRSNIDFLTNRSHNVPPRHRSIRSVFEQSWQLLSEDERESFRNLCFFSGGFTRSAAMAVAGASLTALATLVDKSLVRLHPNGRYDIHDLLRQYGAEQLGTARWRTLQHAYLTYYLGLLRDVEPDIKGQRQGVALDAIAADFSNIRKAWLAAVTQGEWEALNGAVESLHFFADMRGRYHEVTALLQTALTSPLPTPTDKEPYIRCRSRVQARLIRLLLLGNMRIERDLRPAIDTCLEVARTHDDAAEIGFCLLVSGIVAVWEAKNERPYSLPEIRPIFEASHALYESVGDVFYQADVLSWVACTIPKTEDADPGREMLQHSLALRRGIGDRNGIAWITLNLAEVTILELEYRDCMRYSQEALSLMRDIGSIKGILQAAFKVSYLLMLQGNLQEAYALATEMRDLADETNNLDGKMVSAGLLSCLICLIDEAYSEGAVLARRNMELAQEHFFGGHNDLGTQWGNAIAACGLGQYDAARQVYPTLFWDRHDDPAPATACLVLEAAIHAHHQQPTTATELLALAFHQPAYASGWLHQWHFVARLRAELLAELGESAFAAAWEQGSHHHLLTVMDAILGQSETPPLPLAAAWEQGSRHHLLTAIEGSNGHSATATAFPFMESLTERESEVLALLADGLSNRDIAERLVLSVGTVKVHTRNIYSKLNVSSRTQAIAQATKLSLL